LLIERWLNVHIRSSVRLLFRNPTLFSFSPQLIRGRFASVSVPQISNSFIKKSQHMCATTTKNILFYEWKLFERTFFLWRFCVAMVTCVWVLRNAQNRKIFLDVTPNGNIWVSWSWGRRDEVHGKMWCGKQNIFFCDIFLVENLSFLWENLNIESKI